MTITLGNVLTLAGILFGAAVGWGIAKQRLDDHETRIKINATQLANVDLCLLEIKVRLAEIARDILYIREQMFREGREGREARDGRDGR